MKLYQNKKLKQKIALTLVALMLSEIVLPPTLHALTSGPSQPEAQSFEPVGTSEMVDLFTGDFTYNIPLFELPGPDGGYPFNLAYNGGIGMDQEASWTGLGWNINAGAINRQMRGIPDDFAGDKIIKTGDMKPAFTVGIGAAFRPDAELLGTDVLGFSAGVTPYYNNYKGFGYSVSSSPSLQFGINDNVSLGFGANMSSDAFDGKSYSPNFSLKREMEDKEKNVKGSSITFSVNYNNRMGASKIGLGVSAYEKKGYKQIKKNNKMLNTWDETSEGGGGSSISINNKYDFIPSIANEMKGTNLHVALKVGIGVSGSFADVDVLGYVNVQKMKHKNKPVATPAYGFLGLDKLPTGVNPSNKEFPYLMDFNREADGLIDENTKHLPRPVITNDIFSIAGQGVGGMFQANRSAVGFVRDKSNQNLSNGGSIGLDFGPSSYPHIGGSGIFNHSEANNFLWDISGLSEQFNFTKNPEDAYFEQTYFKVHGEKIMEDKSVVEAYLNGLDEPSFIPVQKEKFKTHLQSKSGNQFLNQSHLPERRKRNAAIQSFENRVLKNNDGVLSEFEIKYFTDTSNLSRNIYTDLTDTLERTADGPVSNHIGGFTTLNLSGTRYVYGLPALNTRHEEHAFSVPVPDDIDLIAALKQNKTEISGNTYDYSAHGNQFKDVTEMPEYAHAFLLTSVLGNDYVDLTNDGPSDDDLGYWVKFNYLKNPETYGWRNPFKNASYMPGQLSDPDDDKGHFMYGERENWYLATAETKTHVAEFVLKEREDARGWSDSDSDNLGAKSYALEKINLFSKLERYHGNQLLEDALPVKTIHFRYAHNDDDNQINSLCPGVENGDGQGKLTLTQLWFTYRNNQRGAQNKYYFDYSDLNPAYHPHSYDCWGNYRDTTNIPSPNHSASYPYVPQYFNDNNTSTPNDDAASAWNLKKITTPSGAVIRIEYEADDYAYVQNKKAMQMYQLSANQQGDPEHTSCTGLFDPGINNNQFSTDEVGDYVMVDLPAGFPESSIPKLFDHTGQLYFKVLTPLIRRKGSTGLNSAYNEFVTGYADIDMEKTLDALNTINTESGFKIYLKPHKPGKQGNRFHPITLAAMDYLQLNRSDLIYLLESPLPPTRNLNSDSKEQKRDQLKALVGPIINMMRFNHNFYSNAKCNSGTHFNPLHSFVRLNNVTGFKEGGGLRVKKVAIKESEMANDEYGQHYDYSMQDEEWSKVISSGVATWEPNLGSEQNAVKKALKFDKKIKARLTYNLHTEYPFNESYFPAPSVGYRKVTVKSINTRKIEEAATDIANSQYHDENGIAVPATGMTINEFYTCKEYPVYVDATELGPEQSSYNDCDHPVIPLVGEITKYDLRLSQGYLIELNDMNGKPKSVASYAQTQSGGMADDPHNSINYYYKDKPETINGLDNARRLTSNVQALLKDGAKKEMLLGLDYDLFMDIRSSYANSFNDGLNFNADFSTPWWVPLLNNLPILGHDTKDLRMIVTNKIIWRTGILKEMVVKNEESEITTRNLAYDAQTGAALLTEIQNNFNDPVYNLNIPAYWKYEGMGPAYENLGLKMTGILSKDNTDGRLYKVEQNSADLGKQISGQLYAGDEFLLTIKDNYYKAYVMKVGEDYFKLDFDQHQPPVHDLEILRDVPMFLTRSGRRNHLDIYAGNVTSLINPLNSNKVLCDEDN